MQRGTGVMKSFSLFLVFSYVKTYPLFNDPLKSIAPRRLRPAGEVLAVARPWRPLDELVLADWAIEGSLDGKFPRGQEAYTMVQSRLSVPRSAAAIRIHILPNDVIFIPI